MSGNTISPIDTVRLTRNIVATMDTITSLILMGKETTPEHAAELFDRFRPYCDADMREAIDRFTSNVTTFPWEDEEEIKKGYNHAVLTHRMATAHAAQVEPIVTSDLDDNQLF